MNEYTVIYKDGKGGIAFLATWSEKSIATKRKLGGKLVN
jgi:hypothetical protein